MAKKRTKLKKTKTGECVRDFKLKGHPRSDGTGKDAHQRRPEAPVAQPEPELHWYRLFTGRAVQRDESGKVVVGPLMPNQNGYPHESEFVNWN